MHNTETLISRLETADTDDELARLVARPSIDEERVLRTYLGSQLYQRLHSLALRRGMVRDIRLDESRPNVIVIPGMFGSELTSTNIDGHEENIWLSPRRIVAGHLAQLRLNPNGLAELDPNYRIKAIGIMKRYYGEVMLALAETCNVHAFWYDWRKSFKIAAAQLHARINNWFGENRKDEAVHIVAHGAGGVVARSYIAQFPEQWRRHNGRLIMLGTPNHGMITAPMAFTGHVGIIQWLDQLDTPHDLADLRRITTSFPSLYQLLPSPLCLPDMEELYKEETYSADLDISQEQLDNGRAHHELLHKSAVDPERMIIIAGANYPTFFDIDIDKFKENPLDPDRSQLYKASIQGDGVVAHSLTLLQDVPTYYIEALHGDLQSNPKVLGVLNQLLTVSLANDDWRAIGERMGLATEPSEDNAIAPDEALAQTWQKTEKEIKDLVYRTGRRGGKAIERNYITAEEQAIERLLMRQLMAGREPQERANSVKAPFSAPRIKINLVYGDITKIDELLDHHADALAVGHYSGGKSYGAIEALDQTISATLANSKSHDKQGVELSESDMLIAQFTQRGIIRGELAQPFLFNDPRPTGREINRVIAVAGMGVPGRFGVPELTVLVRELCWTLGRIGKTHLATLLIGTGLDNLPVGDAIAAWVRGIKNATTGNERYTLEEITFIELDPGKVIEIDEMLQKEQVNLAARNRMQITYEALKPEKIEELKVKAREFETEVSQTVYQRSPEEKAPTRITVELTGDTYRFGAITNIASIPERTIPLDPKLVMDANNELAAEWDPSRQLRLGQFMQLLLIPQDLRDELSNTAPLVMMLDATTARIHWELLATLEPLSSARMAPSDKARQDCFLGTSRGFTRQLRTAFAPPPEPPPPAERILRALIVADPAEDARLPGAEEEGVAVADLLEHFNFAVSNGQGQNKNRIEVVRLFGPREATRTAVLRHLMTRTYDVLHFAGHCVYDSDDPSKSGWIFTDGERLTANEFRRIDRVPKFIFSNACESGITPDRSGERSTELAPTLAEAFFERGVSNFVCTAWPVDDRGALEFALTLYARLLGLEPVVKTGANMLVDLNNYQVFEAQPMHLAMRDARLAIADPPNDIRTWGAYQHYGNPYYRFFAPFKKSEADKPKHYENNETNAKTQAKSEFAASMDKRNEKETPISVASNGSPKQANRLYFNGINGATGEPGLPPMTDQALAKIIQGEPSVANLEELKDRIQQKTRGSTPRGVKEGVDPKDLAATGWGVIFADNADPAIQEAIKPLLDRRREQAGSRFKIFAGADGYRPDESKLKFLERHGAGAGPVDPEKIPYYLLIVGSPESIPFTFQYQLDVQHAVGRVFFETPEAYAAYARNVVAAETEMVARPSQVTLFGVASEDDRATQLSTEHLVEPLLKALPQQQSAWTINSYLRDQATKDQLAHLLGGDATPALLFTTSHGMEFPAGDPRQIPHQGALLCADWPGPKDWREPIPEKFYFSGGDLLDEADLLGLLTFHFACYGAGTPQWDQFTKRASKKKRKEIAPAPFIARLPMKLLQRGALAVIGHVERAWSYAFHSQAAGRQTTVFESTLRRLLNDHPVGSALEYFNERYAELSSELSIRLEAKEGGQAVDPYELVELWTANNDARSYVILGDPAVRLPAASLNKRANTRSRRRSRSSG